MQNKLSVKSLSVAFKNQSLPQKSALRFFKISAQIFKHWNQHNKDKITDKFTKKIMANFPCLC